jgi:ABC-type branched-subunit amino acid transport system substrate-binding protein
LPIEIVICDTRFDPNEVAACGRSAVEEGVLAMIGSQPVSDDQIYPILVDAGIPAFGNSAGSTAALTSPNSFTFYNALVTVFGSVNVAKEAGETRIVPVTTDTPTATGLLAPLAAFGESIGVTLDEPVLLPQDATDMSAFAADALGRDGAILIISSADQTLAFLNALLQQGGDMSERTVIGFNAFVGEGTFDALQGSADGLYLVGTTWPSTYTQNPGVAQYNAEIDALGDEDTIRNEIGIEAWAAVHVIAERLFPQMSEVSVQELTAVATSVGPIVFDPLAPFDWSTSAVSDGILSALRTFSTGIMVAQVQDGVVTPVLEDFVQYDGDLSFGKR